MIENSQTLQEKENKYVSGDLGSVGVGAMIGGPFGAAAGLLANKLYKWGRGKYLANKEKNKNKTATAQQTTDTKEKAKSTNEDDLESKIKKAQDEIKNTGMFEPEVYDTHTFYQTNIFDERDPNNNFIFISRGKNGGDQAYKSFLDYWTNKWASERESTSDYEKREYQELIKDRFHMDPNKECLITVPQYFIIDRNDVLSMAKNSDILDKEGVVYYDKPSFDSNFVYDNHMSQYRKEDVEEDNIEDYKISLLMFSAFGTKYTYAFDKDSDVEATWPSKETESVFMALGEELSNDVDEDKLQGFTRVITQLVESEKIITDVYTVAAPLLRKNAKTAQDLEYNANLLAGVGIYESEEQFKKNYLEDYQKLLDNQMGI